MQTNPEKNSQTTKISMVFFEGVTVQHPLTVINSKFSQPFLNFPNRFMKKRHKTGYTKSVNTSIMSGMVYGANSLYCDDLHLPKM